MRGIYDPLHQYLITLREVSTLFEKGGLEHMSLTAHRTVGHMLNLRRIIVANEPIHCTLCFWMSTSFKGRWYNQRILAWFLDIEACSLSYIKWRAFVLVTEDVLFLPEVDVSAGRVGLLARSDVGTCSDAAYSGTVADSACGSICLRYYSSYSTLRVVCRGVNSS